MGLQVEGVGRGLSPTAWGQHYLDLIIMPNTENPAVTRPGQKLPLTVYKVTFLPDTSSRHLYFGIHPWDLQTGVHSPQAWA